MLGKRLTIENDFFELGLEVFFSMSRGVFDQFWTFKDFKAVNQSEIWIEIVIILRRKIAEKYGEFPIAPTSGSDISLFNRMAINFSHFLWNAKWNEWEEVWKGKIKNFHMWKNLSPKKSKLSNLMRRFSLNFQSIWMNRENRFFFYWLMRITKFEFA